VQGLLEEVVGIGSAVLRVVGLLCGGQGGVVPPVHAHLLVGLGLGDVVVGHGVVVVGHFRGGVFLVAHGGGYGVLIAIEEIVPDQKGGHQHDHHDADGPIDLRLVAHGLFLGVGLIHDVW